MCLRISKVFHTNSSCILLFCRYWTYQLEVANHFSYNFYWVFKSFLFTVFLSSLTLKLLFGTTYKHFFFFVREKFVMHTKDWTHIFYFPCLFCTTWAVGGVTWFPTPYNLVNSASNYVDCRTVVVRFFSHIGKMVAEHNN